MRLLLLAAGVPLVAAEWAGSGACGKCHQAHVERHSGSAHARALRLAAEHPLAPMFRTGDKPLLRDGFLFAFDGASVEGYDRENQIELPLEWTFGSGKQAVAFVNRMNPEWHLELAFSFYPGAKRFMATQGQAGFRPTTLREAAGLLRDRAEMIRCFGCHTTGPVTFSADGAASITEAGVQCEACHGPGGLHVARKAKLSIRKKDLPGVCARCHDQPAPRDRAQAWSVRNQPASLEQSACFVKSKGRLGCGTCHSPHPETAEGTASFNTKCSSCHRKLSPGHGGDCVDCHMPRSSPQQGVRYANHRIGVYGPLSALEPVTTRVRRGKLDTRRESAPSPAPK